MNLKEFQFKILKRASREFSRVHFLSEEYYSLIVKYNNFFSKHGIPLSYPTRENIEETFENFNRCFKI